MNSLMKFLLATHVFIYRFTKGKIGGKLGGNNILLLNTIGRKSGAKRTTPLVYLRDGDALIIIASNGGADRHPSWYYNLKEQEQTVIEVMGQISTVDVHKATPEERGRLWPQIVAKHQQFADYQAKTKREIPLFLLEPV